MDMAVAVACFQSSCFALQRGESISANGMTDVKQTPSPSQQVPNEAPLTYPEQRTLSLINGGFDLLHRVVSAVIWIAAFAYGAEAVSYLAGRETYATLFVQWLTAPETSGKSTITWAGFGLLCAGWALAERKLRQRKTARLAGRIAELEARFDSKRMGSGLTLEGKTPRKASTPRRVK